MVKRKQKKVVLRLNNSFPKALIFLGIVLISFGLFTHTRIYVTYLFNKTEKPVHQSSVNVPHELSIPSLEIDVAVNQGGITHGEWILSDSNALYLPTSGLLGEGYNTILYAHNTNKLFGKLRDIKTGALITVTSIAGNEYTYKVYERKSVNPQDLKALYSTEKNILTLFTCDGWADQFRFIVKARLVSDL